MLRVFHNNTFGRRRCTAEFRVVGYFENLVSKIGMTQNISPSFRSSHSTSLGGCFANYGQVGITQSWTLAKGRHGGKLVRHRHKVVVLLWRAASHVLFICGDFPDFGRETKYAPFGMLGKPESTTIIKGAHYRISAGPMSAQGQKRKYSI